jgi:hypothetical protein
LTFENFRNNSPRDNINVVWFSLIQKMELVGKVQVYGPLTGSSQKSKNQF